MSTATVETPANDSPSEANLHVRNWGWSFMFGAPLIWAPLWVLIWSGHRALPIVGTWTGAVLVLTLAISSYTDFRWRKILNWTTYPAVLWILGLSLLATLRMPADPVVSPHQGFEPWAYLGFSESLMGAGIAFLIMFGIYRLAGGGAGDVKLAVVIGAVLGSELGVLALVYSYVIAATFSILNLVWKSGPTTFFGTVTRNVASSVLPDVIAQPSTEQQANLRRHIALAPFFTMGTLLVLSGVRWGM